MAMYALPSHISLNVMLSTSPFYNLQYSFGTLLLLVLGLMAMVSLTVTVIHVIQGEQDAAKKAVRWLVATTVGFIIILILRQL